MEINLVESTSRGHAFYGWLETWHLFSFGSWYNPERTNFGALLVLNDDIIQGGGGFSPHSHQNMEIITIPLKGDLAHKDSSGGEGIIRFGEAQYMSAGTGVTHSEYNANESEPVSLFQIWIHPNSLDTQPSYDQISLDMSKAENNLLVVASPDGREGSIALKQTAMIYLTKVKLCEKLTIYPTTLNSGLMVLVIEGLIQCGDQILDYRDSVEITDWKIVDVEAKKDSFLLIIEVPLVFQTS